MEEHGATSPLKEEMKYMDQWSNNACLGYIRAALEGKGWAEEKIREVVRAVYNEFDYKTIEEAKRIYERSFD
ncbi:hypothetical protein BJP48_29735 [Paenibacillus odorifer]|nr:hypothetical protein BJP48_29735 [Paenibacillus odorifer]